MNDTPEVNNNHMNAPSGDKRSSLALRALPLLVLAAVLLYFAAQVYNYFSDPLSTTLVYEDQAERLVVLDGWIVRNEEPLPTQSGTVDREVQEGQKVAVGEAVATVYSSDSALTTVSRIETLELQLQQLEYALTSYLDPDAALKLDTSITGDILTLRQTLCGGDYSAAESELSALKAAVLKRDHAYTSQGDISAEIKTVEAELGSLRSSLSGARTVKAPASGTYSAVCDGYETVLTESFLETVTPSRLSDVKAVEENGNVGKLIYGDTWYYVVTLPEAEADLLQSLERVDVRLAKGFDQSIRMQVESVSAVEEGQAVVVLSTRRYLAQVTLLRRQAAEAVVQTYEGLRVPANALRVSEEGVTGVYCVDGENAVFRPVELLYQGDSYALVKPAEGVSDTRMLRAGDEVIATARELFDGKVIR